MAARVPTLAVAAILVAACAGSSSGPPGDAAGHGPVPGKAPAAAARTARAVVVFAPEDPPESPLPGASVPEDDLPPIPVPFGTVPAEERPPAEAWEAGEVEGDLLFAEEATDVEPAVEETVVVEEEILSVEFVEVRYYDTVVVEDPVEIGVPVLVVDGYSSRACGRFPVVCSTPTFDPCRVPLRGNRWTEAPYDPCWTPRCDPRWISWDEVRPCDGTGTTVVVVEDAGGGIAAGGGHRAASPGPSPDPVRRERPRRDDPSPRPRTSREVLLAGAPRVDRPEEPLPFGGVTADHPVYASGRFVQPPAAGGDSGDAPASPSRHRADHFGSRYRGAGSGRTEVADAGERVLQVRHERDERAAGRREAPDAEPRHEQPRAGAGHGRGEGNAGHRGEHREEPRGERHQERRYDPTPQIDTKPHRKR